MFDDLFNINHLIKFVVLLITHLLFIFTIFLKNIDFFNYFIIIINLIYLDFFDL